MVGLVAKYQQYAEYKDSGVEWLGEIPSHWEIIKGGYIGELFGSESISENHVVNDGDLPFIKVSTLSTDGFDIDSPEWFISRKVDKFFRTQENYIVFPKRGAAIFTNKVNIINVPSVIDPNLMGWKVNEKAISKYIALLLKTRRLDDIADVSSVPQINNKHINPQKFPLPPIAEQKLILGFIDYETAKIDSLIEKQQQLIQLLKEKRQAVISHAVTKGLDPSVKMKDSGVEWLGEVPEHWDVSRFKFVCTSIIAGPFGSSITKDMYVSNGYKVYGQEQVIPNDFNVGDYYISEKDYIELNRYAVYPKDILISCVGTFGKIAVFPDDAEKGIINPRLIKTTINKKFNPYFFREYLKSDAVFKQFEQLSRGGTMGVINIGILNEILTVVPPRVEQDDIYNFIQHQKNKFNNLIKKAESAIQLMQERRTALISAAVTGKIDVRNWQAPNATEREMEVST